MSSMLDSGTHKKFCSQRSKAKVRGIPWSLTFEQWLSVWIESGRFAERGIGKGRYVMARFRDVGPHSIENVAIQLCEHNNRDARLNNPAQARETARKRVGSGRGWTFVKRAPSRPYQVVVSKRYIGSFATQLEAEAAYRLASDLHRRALES